MLKGRIRGIYLRGEIYWFGKQVNGRRSVVSLETRDYAEAVERARERELGVGETDVGEAVAVHIAERREERADANRFSKASADTKAYVLKLFAEHVKMCRQPT